jgi:hypothetical protein
MDYEGQGHQEKRHKVLMCGSHKKFSKETPPKLHHKNPKKRLRKSTKRENGKDNKSLEEPRRIYYTYQERFIQDLACHPVIHPSLKISP